MPTPEELARLKAIADVFRGATPSPEVNSATYVPTGNLVDRSKSNLPPVQNVPNWALHDVNAPETQEGGLGTVDDMAAARAKQLQQNNLASQVDVEPQIDMSKYQPYVPQAPQPRQFPAIQAKIQSGQPVNTNDIRSTTKANQALRPDQEAALNKQLSGSDEDEDEDKNTRGSTTDTGTLGGI